MSWTDDLGGCFGEVDGIFGSHPLDEQRAKKMISDAKAAGASARDFEKEVVWRGWNEGWSLEHTKEQVDRAKRMWPV